MKNYAGDYPALHTAVTLTFDSFAAATGASSATSSFVAGDVQIYKDGGTTQRSSSAGITVSTSFDSNTGLQMIVIDTSDNTDAGFYAAGHEYDVAVADVTIDAQTVRFWAGSFSIERAGGILALIKGNAVKVDLNTIKTQAITCAAGVTVAPFVGNSTAAIAVDASGRLDVSKLSGTSQTARDIGASVLLSTGTGTGQLDFTSGVVKASLVQILGTALTETAGQIAAGFKKFFNIATPAATMDHLILVDTATTVTNQLTGAQIATAIWQDTTAGDFTVALSIGKTIVNGVTLGTGLTVNDLTTKSGYSLSAAGITAIWQDTTAGDFTAANSIGKSIMNGVALGTGLTINGYTGNTPQTGDSFARIGVNGVSLSAIPDLAGVTTLLGRLTSTRAGYIDILAQISTTLEIDAGSPSVYRFTGDALQLAPTGGSAPTAAAIADAVWEEAISDHSGVSGSTAAQLAAAGAAGDPWATPLPGAYSSGQAGKLVGDNINATISSRATQTSVDTIDDYVDTEIAGIKAKTDNLPSDPASASTIATAFGVTNGKIDAVDDYVDTEVALIISELAKVPKSDSNVTLNATVLAAIADALLNRNLATGSDSGSDSVRTMRQALRILRNKWVVSGGTLSVKKEDDSTESWSAAVTGTPGADPVTGVDPTGP
jgi:hypothetical protein